MDSPNTRQEADELVLRARREAHIVLQAYQIALMENARAQAEYKAAKARAYMAAEGSIEQRKAAADAECADLSLAAEIADARKAAAREALEFHRDDRSAAQTICSNWRAEKAALGLEQ